MSRPSLKPGEIRLERCQQCGDFHGDGVKCDSTPIIAGEVTSDLPLFDGTTPLPFINGHRFRTPDGRIGTMKHVDATYMLNGDLVSGTAMVVIFDR